MEWFYHLFGQHSPRQRERAGYEARIKGLNENILSLSDRMHGIEAERDGLRTECQRLSDYSVELLMTNAELKHENLRLKNGKEPEELLPLKEATTKKPRSRAKPQEKEEGQ